MDYKEIICDPNNLYRAYEKSIKGSKWKESSQKTSLSFLDLIFDLSNDLYDQTYKSGKEYKFVLHERGRKRAITSLTVRDRIVRHVLCDDVLEPQIRKKIIYDNGASLSGRGLSFSKNRFEVHLQKYFREHQSNKGYILFGDYSKFYDNIDHAIAKKMLLKLVDNDSYIQWLFDLIFDKFIIDATDLTDEEFFTYKYGVFNRLDYIEPTSNVITRFIEKSINIGDQLSQLIGIYYPHSIDNYIKIVEQESYYGRYMDDWYIINPSKERLFYLLDKLDQLSKTLGLHININKTRVVPFYTSFSFLQTRYTVSTTGKINKKINSKRVVAMRQRLKKMSRKVETNDILYEDVENMFKSWMGSFYKLLSKEQLDNLLYLYENLFSCKISILNNKLYIERNKS